MICQNKPKILRIYESKEMEGTISPYIVRMEIEELISTLKLKNKKVYDLVNLIPNMSTVCGSNQSHQNISSNCSNNNIIWGNYQDNKISDNTSKTREKILPPHKVYCDGSITTFESNIYRPCITPLEKQPNTPDNITTYPTGNYPNDVNNYPNLKDIGNFSFDCYSCHQHCSHHSLLHQDTKLLKNELYGWLDGIVMIQIFNLIQSLISSNKLPLDTNLMITLRKLFETIIKTDINSYTKRIGVFTYNQRTISSPHNNYKLQVFIQIEGDATRKESVLTYLKEVLKPYNDDCSIMVFDQNEYISIKNNYPINVCFECSITHSQAIDLSTIELFMVNENQFTPKILLKFNNTSIVRVCSMTDCVEVPSGYSGSSIFAIQDSHHTWDINSVTINNHNYKLKTLIEANSNPELTREYEYSSVSAEVKYKDHPILTLSYKNITSNIEVTVNPVCILPKEELDIDRENIDIPALMKIMPSKSSTKNNDSLSIKDESFNSLENSVIDDNNTNDNNTGEEEKEEKIYAMSMKIPFIGIIKDVDITNIKLLKVIHEDDKISLEPCPNSLISTGFLGDEISVNKSIGIFDSYIKNNTEYILAIRQGALVSQILYTDPDSFSSQGVSATNQLLTLRFLVNVNTETVELLQDNDLLLDTDIINA